MSKTITKTPGPNNFAECEIQIRKNEHHFESCLVIKNFDGEIVKSEVIGYENLDFKWKNRKFLVMLMSRVTDSERFLGETDVVIIKAKSQKDVIRHLLLIEDSNMRHFFTNLLLSDRLSFPIEDEKKSRKLIKILRKEYLDENLDEADDESIEVYSFVQDHISSAIYLIDLCARNYCNYIKIKEVKYNEFM